jgi:hypothetical protein
MAAIRDAGNTDTVTNFGDRMSVKFTCDSHQAGTQEGEFRDHDDRHRLEED